MPCRRAGIKNKRIKNIASRFALILIGRGGPPAPLGRGHGPRSEERNGAWAVLTAEQASQAVGGKQPVLLDVLAAALAEVGQFDRAVAVAQQATQIAATHGQANLAAAIAERRAYRGRRAFRHP